MNASARVDVVSHFLSRDSTQLDVVTASRNSADTNVLDRAVDVADGDSRAGSNKKMLDEAQNSD